MKKFLPVLLLVLLMTGCNPSQMAKDELVKFTERIEQKSDRWSEADWDDNAQYFSEICQTLDRYEYDEQQTREIDSLKSLCRAKFRTHRFGEVKEGLEEAVIEINDAFNEILNAAK